MRPRQYLSFDRAAIIKPLPPAVKELPSIPYSPISEALVAFLEGNNHRAAALFHGVDLPGCAGIRARIWFRLLRFDRVIAEYTRRALSSYDPQESLQLALTACHALAMQGDRERAFDTMERAREIARSSNDRFFSALCAEYHSSTLLILGDIRESRRMLGISESLTAPLRESKVRKVWHFDLVGLKARLSSLKGWHSALEGDFRGQGEAFLESAKLSSAAINLDRFLESTFLDNLAAIICRQSFENGANFLKARYYEFPWTTSTDEIKSRLGHAMQDYARLFGFGDAFAEPGGGFAPTLAQRLSSAVAMLLHVRWQEKHVFLEELRFCVSVTLDVDWSEVLHSFPTLLEVAALVAPFDLDLARKVKATYDRYRPFASRHLFGALEPTAKASELFCDGCISKAEGNFRVAIEQFGQVLEILSGDACFPTAAIAGIERYTMTKMPADLAAPLAFVESFPRSSFSLRLRDALANVDDAACGDFPYLGIYGTIEGSRSRVEA